MILRANTNGLFQPCRVPGSRVKEGCRIAQYLCPESLRLTGESLSPGAGIVLHLQERVFIIQGEIIAIIGVDE